MILVVAGALLWVLFVTVALTVAFVVALVAAVFQVLAAFVRGLSPTRGGGSLR